MRLFLFTISLILSLYWATGVWCQNEFSTSEPIQIVADRMETSQKDGAVLFSGNVQANQGSLIIRADNMTVQYTRAEAEKAADTGTATDLKQQIEKILARGSVKIVQGNWVAAGDTMDFNASDRIVILTGNAKAWQDQNMVSGEKIILYLDEGKSVVEKSERPGERVKALIYPPAPNKKDTQKP